MQAFTDVKSGSLQARTNRKWLAVASLKSKRNSVNKLERKTCSDNIKLGVIISGDLPPSTIIGCSVSDAECGPWTWDSLDNRPVLHLFRSDPAASVAKGLLERFVAPGPTTDPSPLYWTKKWVAFYSQSMWQTMIRGVHESNAFFSGKELCKSKSKCCIQLCPWRSGWRFRSIRDKSLMVMIKVTTVCSKIPSSFVSGIIHSVSISVKLDKGSEISVQYLWRCKLLVAAIKQLEAQQYNSRLNSLRCISCRIHT